MTKKNAAKDAARARQAEHGGNYEANLRTVLRKRTPDDALRTEAPIEGRESAIEPNAIQGALPPNTLRDLRTFADAFTQAVKRFNESELGREVAASVKRFDDNVKTFTANIMTRMIDANERNPKNSFLSTIRSMKTSEEDFKMPRRGFLAVLKELDEKHDLAAFARSLKSFEDDFRKRGWLPRVRNDT